MNSAGDNQNKGQEGDDEQGCVICALKPLMLVCKLFGIYPLNYTCPHTSTPTVSIVVRFSILWVVLNLVYVITLSYFTFHFISQINFGALKMLIFAECLQFYHIVIAVACCFTFFLVFVQIQREFKGLNSIIGNAKKVYGVDILFTKKSERSLRRRLMWLLAFVLFYSCTFVFELLYKWSRDDIVNAQFLSISLLCYVAFDQCLLKLFMYSSHIHLYTLLFEEINAAVEKYYETVRRLPRQFWGKYPVYRSYTATTPDTAHSQLISVKPKSRPYGFYDANGTDESSVLRLTSRMCRIRKLYSAVFFNFKLFNMYHNPDLLITIVMIIVYVILNVYLICVILIDGLPPEYLFSRLINVIGIAVGSMAATISANYLENSPDTVTAFLYSCPLSTLTMEEASQLEFYLRLLREQQPFISVSGAFVADSKILGAITGTIITYILILLQFRSS